jgi:hypothetical protein
MPGEHRHNIGIAPTRAGALRFADPRGAGRPYFFFASLVAASFFGFFASFF